MFPPPGKTHKIYWTALSKEDRIHGISRVESCILHHGFIVEFHFFSDISASLIIEIPENKVHELHEDLSKIIHIDEPNEPETDTDSDCTILLNITFLKNTGNARNEVPAVPG